MPHSKMCSFSVDVVILSSVRCEVISFLMNKKLKWINFLDGYVKLFNIEIMCPDFCEIGIMNMTMIPFLFFMQCYFCIS